MALNIVLEGCTLWLRTGNITHILDLKQTEPRTRAGMSHMNAASSLRSIIISFFAICQLPYATSCSLN